MNSLRLKPGKEKSLLRRHPWVFDGAMATGGGGVGSAEAGETVRIESHDGQFLGWAAYSPQSKIRARVWSFDEAQRIDASFFVAACARSIRARSLFDIQSDGIRLIHGESDGLPGLVVDRYGDTLVAQFSSCEIMVVAKSYVCQHLVAKRVWAHHIGFGQFCNRENVFDLRKRPDGSMRSTEQVYVSRRVKAAN
jgi:23S rRNA G2069 N7-methylase RlmK/C1962 C5-methylase RlmI